MENEFQFDKKYNEMKERIENICKHYNVSTFWAQDMTLPEIEWFEQKIKDENKND